MSLYPAGRLARNRWILERRLPRSNVDAWKPYHFLHEVEPGPDGAPLTCATLFLTNRECPFRCVMCDLWRNTLEQPVPPGAITTQIRFALERLPPARSLKLYNAGSFFDPKAIPREELAAIARLCAPFERVVVECHPAFLGPVCGEACAAFQTLLGAQLEVAIGLETVHPDVLARLNKGMTLTEFRSASEWLCGRAIDLRAFVLVRPPWLDEAEGVEWACRSLDFAQECGAGLCAVIPTRAGNGAMDALQAAGEFTPPTLGSLEAVLRYGIERGSGRVVADLWDIEKFAACAACGGRRAERLERMNREQRALPAIQCETCRETSG